MSTSLPLTLSSALKGKPVVVTIKNGVIVGGKLLELEHETGTVVMEVDATRQPRPLPAYFDCLDCVAIRGSSIAFIDFGASQVNLAAVTREHV